MGTVLALVEYAHHRLLLWRSIKYEEVYLYAYASVSAAKKVLSATSRNTTRFVRTVRLTGSPRMSCTLETCLHYPRQLGPYHHNHLLLILNFIHHAIAAYPHPAQAGELALQHTARHGIDFELVNDFVVD